MTARRRGPAVAARGATPAVELVVATTRERVRRLVARSWPRGRATVRTVRDPGGLAATLGAALPDLVIVDTGDRASTWALPAALAQRLAPVAAIVPRSASPDALVALGAAGVVELVLDGVDDPVLRSLLAPHLGTARFTARCDALLDPYGLGETAGALWRTAVSHRGRLVRVATAARLLGVSREHLARTLVAAGAPGPKTLLELVRLLAVQGALARGATVAAAARALGYATPSHLARAARRVVGATPRGWAGLTGAALVAAALAGGTGGLDDEAEAGS
jgi:AraC-like DNA-binding protein